MPSWDVGFVSSLWIVLLPAWFVWKICYVLNITANGMTCGLEQFVIGGEILKLLTTAHENWFKQQWCLIREMDSNDKLFL